MLCTIYVLFVIYTALANTIAMAPSAGAAASSNPSVFDFPNEDCDIVRLPGKRGCATPKLCHDAGGLCVVSKKSDGTWKCRQAVVDKEEASGYRRETWRLFTVPDIVRRSCAGCKCVRKNVGPLPGRVQKAVKNTSRDTLARQRGSHYATYTELLQSTSLDRSFNSVEEDEILNQATPQELQLLVESETALAMSPVAGAAASSNLSVFDFPNEDCDILRLPGERGCANPKLCHDAGGLCVRFWGYSQCQQAVVDAGKVSGYRKERWRLFTVPDAVRQNCAGCTCVRKNVRDVTWRVQKEVKDTSGATRARQGEFPSTDRSLSLVREEQSPSWVDLLEPQEVTEPETPIAMRPSAGAAASSNPSVFDFPNEDCDIVRLPGSRWCETPKLCHDGGGLCVKFKTSWGSWQCQQAVVDTEQVSGYRREQWRLLTAPDAVRRNCAECKCVRRNVRRFTWRVQKEVKNTSRTTRARQRESPPTDRSLTLVEEEETLNGIEIHEPQQVADTETPQIAPVDMVDEERTSNREKTPQLQNVTECVDGSHPLLFHNPTYIDPNF